MFIIDESNVLQRFGGLYTEFTEIDGKTLRYVTQHTNDVLHPYTSNTSWDSSNSITLNGLDGFQDNYFLKSFRVLDGVGSITAEIDRGDIILSLSTLSGVTNDKTVSVYPDASMGPFNMIDSMTQDIPQLYLRYWAVNEGAELEGLFTHTAASDWTSLYILKPIYVINGPIVLDDYDVIIPNYAWSNVGFVQCEHTVYNPGIQGSTDPIRTQFAETAVSPVDCQDTLAIALPSNAYVNAISATMEDIIPHDFCSEEGNSSPTNQPIPVDLPIVPDGTMNQEKLHYDVRPNESGFTDIVITPNPAIFGAGATFENTVNDFTLNICNARSGYTNQDIFVDNFGQFLILFRGGPYL